MQAVKKNIYSYVASLFTSITKNIYRIKIPETFNSDMLTNGFILLTLDDIKDHSEFSLETYAGTRMTVEYYIPSAKVGDVSGIMNTTKFDNAQQSIDNIISAECAKSNQTYNISKDGILSSDDYYSNGANSFFIYITSFIIQL